MKLQEKHLEAIKKGLGVTSSPKVMLRRENVDDYGYTFTGYGLNVSSEETSQITKDYMKRFAEWLVIDSEWHYHTEKEMWTDGYSWVTIDKLIEIFLETEK